LLFKGGDQPIDKTVGVQNEAVFVKMLSRVLEA
jgi:hypothetical protein